MSWQIKEYKTRKNWSRIKIKMLADDLEEGIILEDYYIDSGGNKSVNTNQGYHFISLLKNDKQIYFMFKIKYNGKVNGWRVLSDDALSYIKDYKTKKEALKDLISHR